jgi:hypothetical protein
MLGFTDLPSHCRFSCVGSGDGFPARPVCRMTLGDGTVRYRRTIPFPVSSGNGMVLLVLDRARIKMIDRMPSISLVLPITAALSSESFAESWGLQGSAPARQEGLKTATLGDSTVRGGLRDLSAILSNTTPGATRSSLGDGTARWQITVPFPFNSIGGTGTALAIARRFALQLAAHRRTRRSEPIKWCQSRGQQPGPNRGVSRTFRSTSAAEKLLVRRCSR